MDFLPLIGAFSVVLLRRSSIGWPTAPKGFKVELYATGLVNPRALRIAPKGDIFLAESSGGRILRKGRESKQCHAFSRGEATQHHT